jgi:hypothetical protein
MGKAVLFAVAFMACASPVYADQLANPQSSAQFGALRQAQRANPYSKLFEVREALKQAQQQAMQGAPKKKIVCGMTIIEADPFFDQKMKVTPPKDPNVRYTIRAVPPPVCASGDR